METKFATEVWGTPSQEVLPLFVEDEELRFLESKSLS